MSSVVHVVFTKFVAFDQQGVEKKPRYGYVIFDTYANYYQDTFTWETIRQITPQMILKTIEEDYIELYESVLDKGFYFNEIWIPVDETGTITL